MRSSVFAYDPRDIAEYNPADLANLVRYCVEELMKRPCYDLPLPAPFDGAGIYALFYHGDFPDYQCPAIRSADFSRPIYVGRARQTKTAGLRPLFNRLRDHSNSISEAENLSLNDFKCRFLVLHPLWVSTVEDLLIAHYQSLWNTVVTGFGVHDPGGKRHTGDIPQWDVLHPGRRHYRTMIARGASLADPEAIRLLIQAYCLDQQPDRPGLLTADRVLAAIRSNEDE